MELGIPTVTELIGGIEYIFAPIQAGTASQLEIAKKTVLMKFRYGLNHSTT